jgi:NTE family protein
VTPQQTPDPNASAPIRWIPGDEARAPEQGIALCLSGGGSRAMLFHIGAVLRLNELGLLPELARISSVSGGSHACRASRNATARRTRRWWR